LTINELASRTARNRRDNMPPARQRMISLAPRCLRRLAEQRAKRVLPYLRTGARRRSVAQTRNSPSRTTLSSIARQPPWTLAGRQTLCASTRSFGSSPSAGDCRERPSRGHSHSGRAKRACCSVSRARVRSRRAGQNGHLLDQLTFGTTYIWIILENVAGGPAIASALVRVFFNSLGSEAALCSNGYSLGAVTGAATRFAL
jgi:hypothetical protein